MAGITASQIEAYGLPRRVNNPVTNSAPQAPVAVNSGPYGDVSPAIALITVLGILVLIHLAVERGARFDSGS